jgi:hypothetical protein
MHWIALSATLAGTAAAAPPDRPVAERIGSLDDTVLDAADGFVLVTEGDHAVLRDPDGMPGARLSCGDGPVRGALDGPRRVVLVARDGTVCLAEPSASPGATRLRGRRGIDARPTSAGVVRLLADGSLEAHGHDGRPRWRRNAPVGTGHRLHADVQPDSVVVVGDAGTARLDARTGRLLRAVFVPGTRDAAWDGTHAWVGTATGELRRVRLADGRDDTPAWLRPRAADGAVRAIVPYGGQLAVLRASPDGTGRGRLQVIDLAREALALDHEGPDDDSAYVASLRQATPALRWTTPTRTELLAWPDLGALPHPAPLREAPRHRAARPGEMPPPVTMPPTEDGPPAVPLPAAPARTATGPGGTRAEGHPDGTVALAGERDDGGRWQVVYGPVTALGWSGGAWLVAGDEGEGHVVRALPPAGAEDADLPAPAWHPGPVTWLSGDAVGVRAGGPRHLAVHDDAGGVRLEIRGDWRGAARTPSGLLQALDAGGRRHDLRVPDHPLPDAPRATAVHASPDGARAVTFEGDVPVLHAADTARTLRRLPALGAAPRAVAVGPDATAADLAVWRLDDVLDLVDLRRGEVVRSVALGAPVNGTLPWMTWSPSGRFVWAHVRLETGANLLAIDARDGRIAAHRAMDPPPGGAPGRWRALSNGGWLDLDDPQAGAVAGGARPLHEDPARDRRWFATAQGAAARDAAGAETARLDLGAPATAVADDATGLWRAGLVADGTITVTDARRGTVVARRRVEATRCRVPTALRFVEDDASVIEVACDGAPPVRLAWRLGRTRAETPRPPGAVTPVVGRPAVARSPDGDRIAVGLFDGTVRLVRMRDGAQEALWVGHAGPVTDLAWDGDLVASTSVDGTVRLREAATGVDRAAASTFGVPLRTVELASVPDGSMQVVADGDDGFRRRWTVRDTRCIPHDRVPSPPGRSSSRAPPPGAPRVQAQPDGSIDVVLDDGPVPAAVLRWYSDGAWSVDHADGTRIMSSTLGDGSAAPLATP